MMLFLVLDVANDVSQLRMRIGKSAKAFLPGKSARHPVVLIDVICRSGFDVANQIGQSDIGFEADQNVRVVGHAMDG